MLRMEIVRRSPAAAVHLLSREELAVARASSRPLTALGGGVDDVLSGASDPFAGTPHAARLATGVSHAIPRLRWSSTVLDCAVGAAQSEVDAVAVESAPPNDTTGKTPQIAAAVAARANVPQPFRSGAGGGADAFGAQAGVWFGVQLPAVAATLEALPGAVLASIVPRGAGSLWPRYCFRYLSPSASDVAEARATRDAADASASASATAAVGTSAAHPLASSSCARLRVYDRKARNYEVHAKSLLAAARGSASLDAPELADVDRVAMGDGHPVFAAAVNGTVQVAAAVDSPGGARGAVRWWGGNADVSDGGARRSTAGRLLDVPIVDDMRVSALADGSEAPTGDATPLASATFEAGSDPSSSGGGAVATVDGDGVLSDAALAAAFRALRAVPTSDRLVARRSRIHGWGLVLRTDVPKDGIVIEYTGQLVRSPLADRREVIYEEEARLRDRKWSPSTSAAVVASLTMNASAPDPAYLDALTLHGVPLGDRRSDGSGSCYLFRLDDDWIVDATATGSAARFINHCCEPNCYSRVIAVDGDKHIVIMALRDLRR